LKGILGLAIGQGVLFLVTAMGRVCLVVEECRKRRRRQERNRLAREAAQKERKLSEVTVGGESTVGDGDGMPVPESPV
jgi:DNA-binding IclR family transcriptional regulator